jgi:hypothetical protein
MWIIKVVPVALTVEIAVAIGVFVMLGGSTYMGVALAVLEVLTMEVNGKGGGGEYGIGTWRRLNVVLKNTSLSSSARYLEIMLYNTHPPNVQ